MASAFLIVIRNALHVTALLLSVFNENRALCNAFELFIIWLMLRSEVSVCVCVCVMFIL